MKSRILLFLLLLATGSLWGQTVWTYDFGTGTGSYTTASNSITFLTSLPTNGGTYRVRVGGGGGGMTLANPGTSLGSGTELQIQAPSTGAANKFGVYSWSNPSNTFYLKTKLRTTSTNTGSLTIGVGNSTFPSDNNNLFSSYNRLLAAITITYNSSGNISSIVRRNGSSNTTISAVSGTNFLKDTDQEIEIYANNANAATTYAKSGTNNLNAQSWDLWIDGVKMSPDGGWAKAGSLAAGNITGFVFNTESSASNSARMYIDDLEYSNGLPAVPSGDHTITVTQPTGGTISPETIGVEDGEDQSFTATPTSACYTFSHWVVDGSNAGSANPYTFTNVTADHTITAVFNAVASSTITATAGANGSISPSGATSVACGGSQAYTITPNSGYAVADVLVNGVSVGAVTTYEFTNVTANQTISATFEEYTGPCHTENFSGVESSASYATRTWTGVGGEWSATDARGDQTINGKAITIRNGVITSPQFSDGIGTLTFKAKFPFSETGTGKDLVIAVNGITVGILLQSEMGETNEIITKTIPNINIAGDIVITFTNSSTARYAIDDLSWTCYSATPEPELTLTQNSNSIAHNGTYDFGNQLVNESSLPITFTIQNTGNADLTLGTVALSGADAGQFSLTQPTSPVTDGDTTTFTITFSPTSLGAKTATVTIPNNDNTNYTFTVTGMGSYSSDSDIVANTSYSYINNIDYTGYQVGTITNTFHSVGVFQFAVRDGGDAVDSDGLPTTLTDLTINYTGTANTIRAAALFNGNAMIANGVVTANGISFSGLSIVAPDNGSTSNITLRVTFTETVTDNEKLVFTIASATADSAGSVFGSTDASGAHSDNNNGNNRNRIEVTADRLAFVQQPSNTDTNVAMTPAVTVAAVDAFGNIDLDFADAIEITSEGTLTGEPVEVSAINGLATFSNLVHTATGTGLKLQATSGIWSAESNTFDITAIVYPANTYRTASSGTWPSSSTSTWEQLSGSTWVSSSAPSSNTNNLLIIRHTITTNNTYGAQDGQREMIIEEGGTFISNHACTFGELIIKNGGIFEVGTPQTAISATGTLTVENGGRLILNSGTLDNADDLWDGVENFMDGSIVELKNWDWDNSTNQAYALIGSLTQITPNSEGYYFGNLYINASPSENFRIFRNSVNPGEGNVLKLTSNNLEINNNSVNAIQLGTATAHNVEIKGNVIVNNGLFRFASLGSSTVNHTVLGDIIINNNGKVELNPTSGGASYVSLAGNLDVKSGGILNGTVNGSKIIFKNPNSIPQTISIAGTLGTYVDFEVAYGAEVHLINQHLNLANATNDFTVLEGGSLHFNYFNTTGAGKLTQNAGGILKITDANGIQTSGASGNVQSARDFSQSGHFHYVGNVSPQSTGNIFGSGSTSKRIVINKDNASDVVNLGTYTGSSNELYIAKGIFVETESAYVYGSGNLTIDDEGYLKTAVTSVATPRLSGTYTLAANSTIELNASADQILRNNTPYGNLIFSNGGTTTSGANSSIAGTVTIKDDTILDVGNSTFGGSSTNLVMQDVSRFINGGSATKPNIGGTYTLAPTSTIEFTGTAATQIRVAPSYANIIISGTNVTAGSTSTAGLTIQDGTTFTIKDGATFKVPNPQGMYGNTQTAIKNSPAITFDLEANSTVEYNAAGEEQLISKLNNSYGNLALKGAGSVKKLPSIAEGNVGVKKDLSLDAEVTLDIESGKTLLVGEKLNNSGDVIVRNSANFVQLHSGSDQNVNSGNFKVERVTRPMNRSSYTYWGAPVSTTINNSGIQWLIESVADSGNFDSQVASNQLTQIFRWNPTGQSWENAIGFATVAGDGFIAKAPNNFPSAANSRKALMAAFQGAPFNGNITKEIVPNTGGEDPYTNAKMTFMSNPYPSAINIDKFLLEYGAGLAGSTPRVVPTVYLWTHASTPTNGVYSASDFATYTLLGGTATEPEIDNESPDNSLVPEGKIASGQGFFIRGTEEGGTVILKNSYRYINEQTAYNNGQFFRMANTDEQLFERHRFWLNLKGNNGQFKQTLIGYSDIASDGVDGLDGSYYEGGNPTNLYTILDDRPFVIQAYALPFDINDEIPLGFKVGANGSYSIGLSNFDGLFEFQTIYLKDSYQDVIHNLKDSDYQFTAQAGDYTNRFKVIFKPYSCDETTIWNGTAWSNGEPMLSKKVVIQGDLTLTENMETCEMIVQSGVLTVSSGVTLTVRGKIVNTLGANHFIVENEANLVQIEEVENEGDIKVYRNSAPIKHLDYTIWSSPVEGQVLQAFSPETLPHRIYTYNSATNAWVNTGMNPAVDAFKAGEAYMFRAPNNFITTPYIYSGLFTGTPNNGTIDLTVNSNKFIGLGNPYPSNLKIDGTGGLRSQNPGIGSLYFWTNTNSYDSVLQAYTGNNWSVYSLIGGVAASNDDFNRVANGYIPVGQGFLVEAPSLERVTFNNQMRTSNQGVFFRIAQDEMHRYWLEFRKEEQVFNKILVGYTPESTSEFDFGIDAKLYGYNGSALYSLINEDENPYAIQGRALPFDLEDVVPLGYKAIEAGTYSISLVNLDGLFEDTDIFIKDKMLDIEHNIKSGAYEFVTESGEFLDRLEIVYRTNLNVQNPTIDNNWIAYLKDNQIQLESVGFDMKEVRVYDMLGRVVYSETNVNANKHHIHNLGANQVLIIKIVTSQGTTSVKKFQK